MTAKKITAKKMKRPSFPDRHIEVTDSTMIEKVHYDRKTKTLDAIFKNSGKRYRYADVPVEIFVDFVLSESLGKFFNDKIRDIYDYREVKVRS